VLAMKALWTQEEASFHGEFVKFDRAISFPKPVQRPHPPILFGGATASGRARVVEYCDGWIPIDVLLDDLPAAIDDLRRRAETAGRGLDALSVSVFAFQPPRPDAIARPRDLGRPRGAREARGRGGAPRCVAPPPCRSWIAWRRSTASRCTPSPSSTRATSTP